MGVRHLLVGTTSALWRSKVLSPAGVYAFQQRRLRGMLAHARAHVPFYRDLHAGSSSATPFTDLPHVTKAALMARFDDTITGGVVTRTQVEAFGKDRGKVGSTVGPGLVLSTTSGTTGMVGYFVSDEGTWDILRGTLFARLLADYILNPFESLRYGPWNRLRMGFVTAMGGHYITYLLSLHAPAVLRPFWNPVAFSILSPMKELCDSLNRYSPHLLHGYPTYLEALAHEQLQGRLRIAPKVVSLSSEPLTPSARAALKAAFPRSHVRETYGTTECVCVASPCRDGNLHVNEDVCVLESVDASGNPVPDGKLGARVLLTNLVNRVQPLIRYEIGDQVIIGGQPCSCGSPFKAVKVLGRTDDTFFLRGEDGLYHAHTPIPWETLFLEVPGVRQYQLVHERQNELRVRYTRDAAVEPAAVKQRMAEVFARYLESHGLGQVVAISYDEVDEIPRDPNTQKVRQIVSQVPRPGNADELSGPWRIRGVTGAADGG